MNSLINWINAIGAPFVQFSLEMLLQSGILILVLLVLDRLLRKHVRAVVRYWIWMLVLVKLVLPTGLNFPASPSYYLDRDFDEILAVPFHAPEYRLSPMDTLIPDGTIDYPVSSDGAGLIASTSTASTPAIVSNPFVPVASAAKTPAASAQGVASYAESMTPLSWQGLLFLIWLAVVVSAFVFLFKRVLFVKHLIKVSRSPDASLVKRLEKCRQQMGVRGPIRVRIIPLATPPAVCGLFHPTVLMPDHLLKELNETQLQSILVHELAHVQRGDLWISLMQTLLQISYFYHPLLWIANYVIRTVREKAVDEMVLVALREDADDYPRTLLNVSQLTFNRPTFSLRLIGVAESKNELIARIKHIAARPVPKTARLGLMGMVVLIVLAFTLLPMARGSRTVTEGRTDQEIGTRTVHGMVTDVLDRPRFCVRIAPEGTSVWEGVPSDEKGRFVLEDVHPDQQVWLAWSQAAQRMALFALPDEPTNEPVQVPLDLYKGEIEGRVVGPAGRGMAKRKVQLIVKTQEGLTYALHHKPKTNEDGYYTSNDIPCGNGVAIQARLADANEVEQAYVSETLALRDNQIFAEVPVLLVGERKIQPDYDSNIHKDSAMRCSGRVLTESGEPIEGVKVGLSFRMPGSMGIWGKSTVTDARGRWTRRIPTAQSRLSIGLEHPEFYSVSAGTPSNQELLDGTYTMTMKAGLCLTGTVQDAQGHPIENALVVANRYNSYTPSPEHQIIESDMCARTHADGSFRISCLSPGSREILISSLDFAPTFQTVDMVGDMPPITIELTRGQLYQGRVLDANNTPIAGVRIGLDEWSVGNNRRNFTRLVETDPDGRFTMKALPTEGELQCYFSKRGLKGFRRNIPDDLSQMDEVVMFKPPVFKGKVIDDKTGEPVTHFRLTNGIRRDDSQESVRWSRYRTSMVDANDGSFTHKWAGYSISHPFKGWCMLKVEAQGYFPNTAPPIKPGQETRRAIIRLQRGQPLTGVIRDARGNPVHQAQVAWVGPGQKAFIENGRFSPVGFSQQTNRIVKTDKTGSFEFVPTRDQGLIVALHDCGYAEIHSREFKPSAVINLTPWASMKGTVDLNAVSKENQPIRVEILAPNVDRDIPSISWMFGPVELSGTSFSYNRVPAVALAVGQARRYELHNAHFLTPQPGTVDEVVITDKGQAVTGRLITPAGFYGAPDYEEPRRVHVAAFKLDESMAMPAPCQGIPESSFRWLWQDKERIYARSQHTARRFIPEIRADGSFTFQGLRPGTYEFVVNVHQPLGENVSCGRGVLKAVGVTRFSVLDVTGKTINLPDMPLTVLNYPGVGEAAPDFEVTTRKNESIKLADLRGKVILVDFWASWCSPCLAQMPKLKKLHKKFEGNDRFIMIGLSADWDLEQLNRCLAEHKFPWLQANIGDMAESAIIKAYGIGSLPSTVLIGPDGKILGKNLESDEMENVIEEALRF